MLIGGLTDRPGLPRLVAHLARPFDLFVEMGDSLHRLGLALEDCDSYTYHSCRTEIVNDFAFHHSNDPGFYLEHYDNRHGRDTLVARVIALADSRPYRVSYRLGDHQEVHLDPFDHCFVGSLSETHDRNLGS